MLITLFLLVVFLNSSFIFIFKGASESIKETNLIWSDYMFTIRYLINNVKHPLLLLSGDIESNPGPKRSSNIKFCHWNLNGLAAHDSTIPNEHVNMQINGYSLLRADHPNNIKRGGVCIYFKESLPLI